MKIERFNSINENLTSDVKKFIESFTDNTDNGIVDWVGSVAINTKLNDYKKFTDSMKKELNFAKSKNFKKLEEFLLIDKEVENKEKEIERLNKKKESLSILAGDELLYKFQEDLLNMDFDSFYDLFITGKTIPGYPNNIDARFPAGKGHSQFPADNDLLFQDQRSC